MPSLSEWEANGWLRRHQMARGEIESLIDAAGRDLRDSLTPGLSPAWAFNIAYNGAMRLCTAVLAGAGFRAERDNKHYRRSRPCR